MWLLTLANESAGVQETESGSNPARQFSTLLMREGRVKPALYSTLVFTLFLLVFTLL
jgi:hypothetical protein